jgi:LPXTG-motif cell wall-anchored protein
MRALTGNETGEIATDADGMILYKGLAAGTYILTETDTVDGYNMLTSPITVTITPDAENPEEYTVTITGDGASIADDSIVITIENNSGTLLPSTGGIGTRIFYIVGAILVIGAGVVLVPKRKVDAE